MTLDLDDGRGELREKRKSLERVEAEIATFSNRLQRSIKRLENELEIKESRYEYNRDRMERLKDEFENENSPDFRKLKQNIASAEKDYQQLADRLDSRKELREKGAITSEEFEEFENSLRERKNVLKEFEISLDELRNNKEREIEELKNTVAEQKKAVENLRFELIDEEFNQRQELLSLESEAESLSNRVSQLDKQFARDYIDGDELVAIFDDGVVYNIEHHEGDFVNEGSTLMNIMDRENLIVEADVPEDFIGSVELGQEVDIIPMAGTPEDYSGEVIRIAGKAVEKNVETVVPVEISIDDPDEFLLPDYNVDVIIYVD